MLNLTALELIEHLRAIGETNSLLQRSNMSMISDHILFWFLVLEQIFLFAVISFPLLFDKILLIGSDSEERYCFSYCCNLWLDVCSRWWKCTGNFSGKTNQRHQHIRIWMKAFRCCKFEDFLASNFSRTFNGLSGRIHDGLERSFFTAEA